MRRWLSLVLVAGCGDDSHGHPVDAAVDMAQVGPPGPHYHYGVDKVYLPATNQEAQQYGLDRSGDGMVDNQLGMVMPSLVSQGEDVQTPTDKSIDTGTTIDMMDIQ